MKYLRALISAFSMFTAVSMPQFEWDMDHGSRMTACFGLAGAFIGGLALLLRFLLGLLPLPLPVYTVLALAGFCLLTGFLHLDGFMDVCDALLSHRDPEGCRRILKDPHCGAFAVISLMLLISSAIAALYSLQTRESGLPWVLIPAIPTLSRSAAGLLLLTAPTMPDSSLGAYFKTGNSPWVKLPLLLTGAAAAVLAGIFAGPLSLAALCGGTLLGVLTALLAVRKLGGINGDIAGFTVVLCETLSLLALTLIP